jgi:N-succinyl-L-ornithine transcarbamylase
MKNFISVKDASNINALIEKGIQYKREPLRDEKLGQGKRIGLLFFNPSLRTRVSTQLAAKNLGMDAIVLNVGSEGWSLEFGEGAIMNGTTVEHIKDAAPILGTFFDIVAVRSFPKFVNREEDVSDQVIQSFIKYAGVPIVSLESATRHPLQSLADLITIRETFKEKRKPKVVLTWAPHIKSIPHCVANSFSEWVNAWGEADFVITHPKGYELDRAYTGNTEIIYDQKTALKDADYVYVKNWSSYSDYGKVLGEFPEWMLTEKHLDHAPNAKVMHCLPLRRNVELGDEILDGPRSLLTQMGGNRVWSAQTVLSEILKA